MIRKNSVYSLDCLDFLKRVDNESVDLAVIDPPYGLGRADWDTFRDEKDYFKFTFRWLDALLPKLKDGGSLYIFNTPYNASFILRYLIHKGLTFQNWITWDKRDGFSSARRRYVNGQETVIFFTRGNNHVFNYDEVRVPYESEDRIAHARSKGILKNGSRWFPNPKGKLCGEVWHVVSERHKNKVNGITPVMPHATPKPLELIERIIKASSNKGSLVLDCFVGSGTTAVAAKKLKRNFLCNDSNETYTRLTKERLRKLNG